MAMMTEEEADALDELLTRTTPRVNPSVRGVTARKSFTIMAVDDCSVEYITSKAMAAGQSQEEIVHTLAHNAIEATGGQFKQQQ
jgi:alkylhydroperoxidase/carboxymuconolactone decarboxylase family protein YurZ